MPNSSHIIIQVDGLDGMIKAMKDVGHPSFKTTGRLERALATVYGEAEARVHIISGRLKASGYTESDFDGETWSGSMHWGGDNSPAFYACYEQARGGTRPDGTPHDWLSGLEAFDHLFESAIDAHMREALG